MASVLLIAVVILLISLLQFYATRTRKLPPGPYGLPFLGYAIFFDKHNITRTYDYLYKKYGSVVGLRNGLNDVVLISGWDAVNEALLNEDLAYRPRFKISMELYPGESKGVLLNNGENWKVQRRFSLHNFRNLGFGKRSHESVILEEADYLVKQLKQKNGAPVNVKVPIGVSGINILWAILAGKRHDHNDPHLKKLVGLLNRSIQCGLITGGILNSFPFLRHIAPGYFGYTEIRNALEAIKDFVKESQAEHEATYNPNEMRDFIDLYIQEMRKDEKDASFTEKQMIALIGDLFIAGTETSSSVISFVILFMCKYPHLQDKLHENLDEVVGRESVPTMDHRTRLSYVDAFLNEALRIRNPVGIAIPHYAQRTTTVMGQRIEEGTRVNINIHSVGMDKEYWGDPENFRPDRFITPEGTLKKMDRFIPFGKGRRSCLGEALARMTSFLMFATLAHKLHFKFAPGENPSDEGISGFTMSPPNFDVIATPRF
uniref:Cytochrome P450 epoxidase-like protein n=1 Tax=Hirondellea gigas TaxID=1518452 RepID=A0A6A7G8W0_9CRUS